MTKKIQSTNYVFMITQTGLQFFYIPLIPIPQKLLKRGNMRDALDDVCCFYESPQNPQDFAEQINVFPINLLKGHLESLFKKISNDSRIAVRNYMVHGGEIREGV